MATNNFKAFGIGAGANVTSQADYEALTALLTGFQSGKASSAQINKALRQSSTMAYVLAQFISDSASVDVLDNGTPATIIANMKAAMTNLTPGRLLGLPKVFTSSGTYTPTPGTKSIIVEVLGAGGGGGGAALITSGYASAGSGGGSGSYAKHYLSSLSSSYVVTIGVGGTGGVGNASGNAGGTSSFGSIVICPGGFAGRSLVSSNTLGFTTIDSGTYTAITGGNIVSQNGNSSTFCLRTANTGIGGYGSPSPYGSGGLAATATGNGVSPLANSYGAGGGGALNLSSTSINYTGGQGSNGIVIVWEYA